MEPGDRSGYKHAKLPKIGFVPESDKYAFGFLDPSVVIRGCHLIPTFTSGRTGRLLQMGTSLARKPKEKKDWVNYYVGMYVFIFPFCRYHLSIVLFSFADRDMALRYTNMGVGHQVSQLHSALLDADEAINSNDRIEDESLGMSTGSGSSEGIEDSSDVSSSSDSDSNGPAESGGDEEESEDESDDSDDDDDD